MSTITPQILLKAYAAGVFPMAESADDPSLYWIDPDERGVIPLDEFHLPRRLRRTILTEPFQVRVDTAFTETMDACSRARPDRPSTWINARIKSLYGQLFRMGFCHSVECWRDSALVGGLYGVSIGGAFFGESMFSAERDASKIALVYLVARLKAGGFTLLDTQFVTDHLMQFGARQIERETYHQLLEESLGVEGDFEALPLDAGAEGVLQFVSQTS
ncbi:MAG: leucyl/phenylalanyl-tRNA--protein transferase [Pseudomonadota bacterium]